jgi:hypothetical protein
LTRTVGSTGANSACANERRRLTDRRPDWAAERCGGIRRLLAQRLGAEMKKAFLFIIVGSSVTGQALAELTNLVGTWAKDHIEGKGGVVCAWDTNWTLAVTFRNNGRFDWTSRRTTGTNVVDQSTNGTFRVEGDTVRFISDESRTNFPRSGEVKEAC